MNKKLAPYPASLEPALQAASLALSASHNLTVTDRSNLPRAEWPVYVLDHGHELALIDAALRDLNVHNAPGCGRCKTRPLSTPS
jgi:hypothetical protein